MVCEVARAIEVEPCGHVAQLDVGVVADCEFRIGDEFVCLNNPYFDAREYHFLSVLDGRDFRVELFIPFFLEDFFGAEEEPLSCASAFWADLPLFFFLRADFGFF